MLTILDSSPLGQEAANNATAATLAECADALSVPGWNTDFSQHIAFLDEIAPVHHCSRLGSLIAQVRSRLEVLNGATVVDLMERGNDNSEIVSAVEEVCFRLGQKKYLYHGTVCSRLASIFEEGLTPAAHPVWRKGYVARHSAQGVFFAQRWRTAATFALAAHERSRGPRNGPGRRPVIIRIDAASVNAEPDLLTAAAGCWYSRSSVQVTEAEVFVGPHVGFPLWRPIAQAVSG